MKFVSIAKGVAAAAAVALTAGSASAATVTSYINLSGGGGVDDSYSFSSGALSLTTSGHLLNGNGSIGSQVKIGQYGGGLGVTSSRRDQHFVDSNGRDEVVKFVFDMAVKIEKVWFTYVDRFDDFSFSVISPSGVDKYAGHVDIHGRGLGYYSFAGDYVSDVFGIGAAGFGDEFKIKAIKVSYDDTPAPIPLPAAGWLLIAGLGGLAALRRARRSA